MDFLSLPIVKLGVLVLVAVILSCAFILLSYFFSISMPDSEKLSAYECGFDPYEDARNVFDVRFYLIAIFFIIFDLEAVFFFPLVVNYSLLEEGVIFLYWDFIIELMIGFAYAWQVGALDWK